MLFLKSSKLKSVAFLFTLSLFIFSCGKDDTPGDDGPQEIEGEVELKKLLEEAE